MTFFGTLKGPGDHWLDLAQLRQIGVQQDI